MDYELIYKIDSVTWMWATILLTRLVTADQYCWCRNRFQTFIDRYSLLFLLHWWITRYINFLMISQMSHQLRNPWAEYVRYREEKTKKIRLPTRPKMEMPQLGVWLRGLSTEMRYGRLRYLRNYRYSRDLGHERQASCIHEEIAEVSVNRYQEVTVILGITVCQLSIRLP